MFGNILLVQLLHFSQFESKILHEINDKNVSKTLNNLKNICFICGMKQCHTKVRQ